MEIAIEFRHSTAEGFRVVSSLGNPMKFWSLLLLICWISLGMLFKATIRRCSMASSLPVAVATGS